MNALIIATLWSMSACLIVGGLLLMIHPRRNYQCVRCGLYLKEIEALGLHHYNHRLWTHLTKHNTISLELDESIRYDPHWFFLYS